MSAITALISGTLAQVPVSRTTSKGGTMATASIAVTASSDGKPSYIGIMCFGLEADALLQLDKGDSLAARGKLELNRWVSSDGEQKERWQVVADTLVAGPEKPTRARQAPRPTKSTAQASHGFQQPPEPPPYDDEVPF